MKVITGTNTNVKGKTEKLLTVKVMTVIAMLGTLATILMLFQIPLWFAPFWYELDFSEVPILIGAFAMGPVAGMLIEMIKVLVNLVIDGSITSGVGELSNFLIGCSLVIPAAAIYKKKRTLKGAIQGMVVGTVSMAVFGALINAFLILPAYSFFTNMPMSELVGFGTKANPAIQSVTTLVLFAVVPFNLLKGAVASVITVLLYKRVSILIKTFTK